MLISLHMSSSDIYTVNGSSCKSWVVNVDETPLIERFVRLRYSGLSLLPIASLAILQILIAPFVSLFHSPHPFLQPSSPCLFIILSR